MASQTENHTSNQKKKSRIPVAHRLPDFDSQLIRGHGKSNREPYKQQKKKKSRIPVTHRLPDFDKRKTTVTENEKLKGSESHLAKLQKRR